MATEITESTEGQFSGRRMRARHHFAVSAYWFAVNLLWGSLLIIIIPRQMKQLAPENPAPMLGLLLGMGAFAALVIPLLAGPLSDRCMSRWGRRRPYMLVGTIINLVGLAVVWYAGYRLNLILYFAGYFITNMGNNIATGAYNGIIPDVVPLEQRGTASGWMGAMSQVGTIIGVLSAGVLMKIHLVAVAFIIIGASMVLSIAITWIGIREQPRKVPADRLDLVKFLKSLWIDPRKYPNFAWVWLTRALVVMGLWTVQEYMLYYLTDVMGVKEENQELMAAIVLVTSLTCATITGIIGGAISDRIGRKRVVYAANTVIALACMAFVFSPSLTCAIVIAAVFGLGFGAYYSVDWALGCDVLPNKDDAGKDMAVWHIAYVLPQSIALPLSGALLGSFGHTVTHTPTGDITHYTHNGYTALFSLAAFFLLLGAVLLRNVRGIK